MKTLILPPLLFGLLGSIFVLPQRGSVAESSIVMELPSQVNGWQGIKRAPSSKEIEALAKDTEFEKADYYRLKYSRDSVLPEKKQDVIHVSVVLSGIDINNSIHRPERCLPAQGHYSLTSSDAEVELQSGIKLPVRRLASKQKIRLTETDEIVLDSLSYYFFVGHKQVTNDHLGRTFMDMRDRLFRGFDQRWAYITVSMPFGDVPEIYLETTEEEAERYLQDFLRELAPDIVDWESIQG